jgi:hypothetical protein
MLDLLIDTCENLELIPLDKEKRTVEDYLFKIKQPDTPVDEMEDYQMSLRRRVYAPYCKTKKCPCVSCESPVMSQRSYGFGNFHQSLRITATNSRAIKECPDRIFLGGNPEGTELLDTFLLTHIKTD